MDQPDPAAVVGQATTISMIDPRQIDSLSIRLSHLNEYCYQTLRETKEMNHNIDSISTMCLMWSTIFVSLLFMAIIAAVCIQAYAYFSK